RRDALPAAPQLEALRQPARLLLEPLEPLHLTARLELIGTEQLAGIETAAHVAFDTRPPLAAARRAAPQAAASNTYTITVNAAPGQDANAIARAVAAELDRREQAQGARARSSLFDQE
ncbi:hypothetical protein NA637_15110, partial [Pseudomonas stutzeri]|nr:hypothetical protein [Stutzerimonas stutzeri]